MSRFTYSEIEESLHSLESRYLELIQNAQNIILSQLLNGKKVWISWTNKTLVDKNRKSTEILCMGIDITER